MKSPDKTRSWRLSTKRTSTRRKNWPTSSGTGFRWTQAPCRATFGIALLRVSGQRNVQVATAEKPENGLSERFYRIFSESVLSMTHAYNQIVLKTLPGSANVAAEMIDGLRWPEILGTLAGDNTILMLVRSVEEVDTVLKRIDDMLR